MCGHVGVQMWMVVDADGGRWYKGKREKKTYLMGNKLDVDGWVHLLDIAVGGGLWWWHVQV